jgi:hypothetical protein
MSTKAKGHDENDNDKHDTSHYLGQLNQIYSKYVQSTSVPWDELDEEIKYEFVIKSLFVVRELTTPRYKIKEKLQALHGRGDEFTDHILRFMEDQHLVTKKAGNLHLTDDGEDILD